MESTNIRGIRLFNSFKRIWSSCEFLDTIKMVEKPGSTGKGRRLRSNSSSNGSSSDDIVSDSINITEKEQKPVVRNKYTHVLVLKSLNNTFETKFLVIPFKPNGLKLGRPVIGAQNSGGNNGVGGKGDPQVKADNGNFDSRVLSRNHASLSCDAKTGKICIHDLKSSNGTFVNGTRIGQTDVEIKVGDVIDLGADIDTKLEHRKISALVEDISVIPLISENQKLLSSGKRDVSKSRPIDCSSDDSLVTITTAQKAAFEAAMFGDVNNLDLEDAVLGSETEILSGIFINNSIGTSPNLINIIKTLVTDLTLEKLEYEKLKSIDNFMVNYTNKLDYLSKVRIEQADSQLIKLQKTIKQKLSNQRSEFEKTHNEEVKALVTENSNLKMRMNEILEMKDNEIKQLKNEIEELKTRLEVEVFKNTQLLHPKSKPGKVKSKGMEKSKNLAERKDEDYDDIDSESDITIKQNDPVQLKRANSGKKSIQSKTNLVLLSSISAGALAAIIKYAAK